MKMKQSKIVALILSVVMVLSTGAAITSAETATVLLQIVDLKTEYQTEPLGIDRLSPRFSWAITSNLVGEKQSAYSITVKEESTDGAIAWDSGKVESSVSTAIEYGGQALVPETAYFWQVKVWNMTGESYVSEWTYFETGTTFTDAQWIIPADQTNGAPLLRTEKELIGNVTSARLYITSLGAYEAYVNGSAVNGKNVAGDIVNTMFGPGWTEYNSYINYQSYDVTNLISGNDVALAVMLGKGWYAGQIGNTGDYSDVIGDPDAVELALLAKLVINYDDGSSTVISTNDQDWISSDHSPIIFNDFYQGEHFDARIQEEITGWNDVGYDDSGWVPVAVGTYTGEIRSESSAVPHVLSDLTQNPVELYTYNDTETIPESDSEYDLGEIVKYSHDLNAAVDLSAGDKLIVDLGQNIVGVSSVSFAGVSGTEVTIRHAEMINDGMLNPTDPSGGSDGPRGTIYTTALGSAAATDIYTLAGTENETYQPVFTYHGFRYMEISATSDITISDIQGVVISAVGEQTSTFSSSDQYVNKLFENTLWGQVGNFTSIPTDCPQRAERAGWTGDAQLFSATAVYNYDIRAFYENYIDVMNSSAALNDGVYGAIMPKAFLGFFANNLSSGWSDAGVIIPWVLYQNTGDVTYVSMYYDEMARYLEKVNEIGYHPAMFGDWLSFAGASTPYMNSVYEIYINELMYKMAQDLNQALDVQKYKSKLNDLKAAFADEYIDSEGNILSGADGLSMHGFPVIDNSQTALLWALKLELYENEEQKQVMIDNLLANIANEGGVIRPDQDENTLSVGFLGVNVLLPVLTDIGMADVSYDLLLQDAMPSWLYSVKNGATTIWERWNSYSLENSFGDSGMNSFNHYSYGAVVEWMMGYMSGIIQNQENPGYQKFILQPTIDESGRITYVNGSYKSLYGTIESNWTAQSGNLKSYSAVVPANTSAELYLPISDDISISNTGSDSALTASALDELETIEGVEYAGLVEKNGVMTAKFDLAAGGYEFVVETDGTLTIELAEGYIPLSSLNPEPTPVPSEPTETSAEPTTAPTTDENTSDTTTETTTDGEDVPKTGDELPYAALILTLVAVLAGGGIVLLRKSQKKENTQQDE